MREPLQTGRFVTVKATASTRTRVEEGSAEHAFAEWLDEAARPLEHYGTSAERVRSLTLDERIARKEKNIRAMMRRRERKRQAQIDSQLSIDEIEGKLWESFGEN